MDDFERDLIIYSEIEAVIEPDTSSEKALPLSLQKYKQIVQKNNTGSIFDADYSLDGESKILNEDVTYVNSGRGRGGRMTFFKPGAPLYKNKIDDDDDELRKQIRRVAGLGYSNELIESSLKASRKSKNKHVISELEFEQYTSPGEKTESTSTKSTRSTLLSDKASISGSNYYTAPDVNFSSSPEIKGTDVTKPTPQESASIENATNSENCSKDNIPSKPLPLSLLRKQCKEKHNLKKARTKQLTAEPTGKNPIGNIRETNQNECGENGLPLNLQKKTVQNRYKNTVSSASSSSSCEDILPWRTRINSPPRYPWGKSRSPSTLNIYCTNEFPILK